MPENHDLATANRQGIIRKLSGSANDALLGDGTFGDVSLTSGVTGVLPVANGGTSLNTLTIHAVYVGNAANAPTALAVGDSNTFLKGSTGADPAFGTATLASADFANQGTTSTVLHGNAAGNPSFGQVALTTEISGFGANVAAFLATPSSANLIAALTDETGTGAAVFANTPTLVTPVLGAATATSINFGGTSFSIYAEGTWTPAVTGWTMGNATVVGTHTKIGNRVMCDFSITLGNTTTTAAGTLTITGLPFTAATLIGLKGIAKLDDSGKVYLAGIDISAATSIRFYNTLATPGVLPAGLVTDVLPFAFATGDIIAGSFEYRV